MECSESTQTAFGILDNPLGLPTIVCLGALGMSSLYAISKPKKGQTIFVTVACGAVSQTVGKVAKREGLRAIGSVGRDDKLAFIITGLGFNGGLNYT